MREKTALYSGAAHGYFLNLFFALPR